MVCIQDSRSPYLRLLFEITQNLDYLDDVYFLFSFFNSSLYISTIYIYTFRISLCLPPFPFETSLGFLTIPIATEQTGAVSNTFICWSFFFCRNMLLCFYSLFFYYFYYFFFEVPRWKGTISLVFLLASFFPVSNRYGANVNVPSKKPESMIPIFDIL